MLKDAIGEKKIINKRKIRLNGDRALLHGWYYAFPKGFIKVAHQSDSSSTLPTSVFIPGSSPGHTPVASRGPGRGSFVGERTDTLFFKANNSFLQVF